MRWLALAASVTLAGGIAMVAPAAFANTNEGTQYTTYLAGHALFDNGSQTYNAVWGAATVPSLAGANPAVPADSIAVGVVLAASATAAGPTYGEGLVWDDPASTCGATAWALEEGSVSTPVHPGAPMPVPTSALQPLELNGSDVCVQPGGSEWMKVQQSTRDHVISFLAGSDANDNNVLLQIQGVHTAFFGAGEGVTSTNGADTAAIPTGTLVSFNTFAVNRLAARNGGHATGVAVGVAGNGGSANWDTYDGTFNGGAPAVSNPLTLTASGFTLVNYGTANSIAVP
jgi:hypothetical protein